jgi:Zn-dependent protease
MSQKNGQCEANRGWPLERVLFAMAGSVSLVGGLLALLVSPWFALLPVLAGINQWLYVAVGACPASVVLTRITSLRPATGSDR